MSSNRNMERNYMNHNEIFPILDMINRRVAQAQRKGQNYHFDSPMFGGEGSGGGGSNFDSSQWQVESFWVERDTENPLDPSVIKKVVIVYRNGAIDEITLFRGLVPPVGKDVQDHVYINNLMITDIEIFTRFGDNSQLVQAKIFKENGYGNFQKVELTYNGELFELDDEDLSEEEEEEENPEDFYNGGGISEGYDKEADEAEDFADTEYDSSDEPKLPPSGWADGHNPSEPIEVDVEE